MGTFQRGTYKYCGQFIEVERRSRLKNLDYLIQIVEAKIGKSFDFILDSLKIGMNDINQFSYFRSPLDTLFCEDSKVFGYCLLIDSYSKNLNKYVSANMKGKTKKFFETSAFILVEKKKGQGHKRLL